MLTPEEINAMNHANEEKRLRRTHSLTPQERMERFDALQAAAMKELESNPEALAEFHRRNRFRRRQSQVQLLLAKLKGKPIDTDQS